MTANTTFIAEASAVLRLEAQLPSGFRFQPTSRVHESQLAALWFAAYPPDIASDMDEAEQEIKDMFAGEHGQFWPEASPMVFKGEEMVAAICTVVRAPWDLTPTCPFIIDLMVSPDYRRKGLAAFLLRETARAVLRDGKKHLALRVLADNEPAISLYRKLGFVDWDGELCAR